MKWSLAWKYKWWNVVLLCTSLNFWLLKLVSNLFYWEHSCINKIFHIIQIQLPTNVPPRQFCDELVYVHLWLTLIIQNSTYFSLWSRKRQYHIINILMRSVVMYFIVVCNQLGWFNIPDSFQYFISLIILTNENHYPATEAQREIAVCF